MPKPMKRSSWLREVQVYVAPASVRSCSTVSQALSTVVPAISAELRRRFWCRAMTKTLVELSKAQQIFVDPQSAVDKMLTDKLVPIRAQGVLFILSFHIG